MKDKGKDQFIQDIIGLQEKTNRLILAYRIENWMKLDLTIDQLKSLILIHSRGKISFKDLAKALDISRSNITGLADRLIQNGLLTRNQDSADRRIQYLTLTDKGREIIANIRQEMHSQATRLLTTLDIEELAALEKGLTALIKSAEKDTLFQYQEVPTIT
ncbi:MAG: MarR family transcriptional regulator [Petrimonas sp.]|jgi:DNA-binding MarR family transcriptional regulator|nr:MarR family transcriptional regulator [Petrimonas sp.]